MKNLLKKIMGGVKRMSKAVGSSIKDACGLIASKEKIYERRVWGILLISFGVGLYTSTYIKA